MKTPTIDYESPTTRRGSSPLNTRGAVLMASIVVFIATIVFYTKSASSSVFLVLMTDGLFAVVWTVGACALGAVFLGLLKVRVNALLFAATAGGLGLGVFSLAGLGLGLMGALNRGVALGMPVSGVALFVGEWLWRKRATQASPLHGEVDLSFVRRWLLSPAGLSWLWIVPAVSLATACVAASDMPGDLWRPFDPDQYDVVSYHLQVPREWYEAGRIVPLEHNVFSYFPFNVEMQFLLAMHASGGPWRGMYVCQFIDVMYGVLMVLGVAGAVGRGRNGVVGAAVVSSVPWVMMLAGVAYVEAGLMLYVVLAVGWVLVGLEEWDGMQGDGVPLPCRGGRAGCFLVAGVMGGLACGVKITAVPMLLGGGAGAILVVGVWGYLKKRPTAEPWACWGSVGGNCLAFLLAGVLVLSPWLIRNFVWCGNPLFPVGMKILGRAHFSLDQVERFRLAHSPQPSQEPMGARLKIVWTDVLAQWQYGYVLFPAAFVAAVLRWRDRGTWVLFITGVIIFLVWIGFTHLLARFLVMLVPLAGVLIARVKWGRMWPASIVIVVVAAIFGWSGVFDRLSQTTRDPVRSGLLGIGDMSFLVPPELAEMKNSDKQVGLVGDAGAFLYQIPMTRLHYRTVFDLPAGGNDPIETWVGARAKGDTDWLIVVNPAEVARLHRTYWKVPGVLEDWKGNGDEPFVVRGSEVK